jgi:UDP-2,3-diacylglucosamine hydrolase
MSPEVIAAPPEWRCVDFISDLHLHLGAPKTAEAWFQYMAEPSLGGTSADAIFILGDWFEVWLGDDDEDPFISLCASVMRRKSASTALFLMHGNRDFLLGQDFASRCGATLLPDPTRLDFQSTSYLLSHGDALCTSDTSYMKFREIVRSEDWQAEFLAKPLPERRNIAQKIRSESRSINQYKPNSDPIDDDLALDWLNTSNSDELIHGHTHLPATHALGHGKRHVISDWDATSHPIRLEILRLNELGLQRVSL